MRKQATLRSSERGANSLVNEFNCLDKVPNCLLQYVCTEYVATLYREAFEAVPNLLLPAPKTLLRVLTP